MAQDKTNSGGSAAVGNNQGSGQPATRKKHVRKVYTHTMTEREKWALQIVLKAKGACTQLAIAIQEGKQVSPQAIGRCSDVIQATGDMIFA